MKEKKKFLGQIPFFLFSVRGTFFCPYSNFSTMVISSTRRCGMSACQGGTGAWRHNPWVDRSIPIIESIALRITLTEFRFSGQAKLRLTWSRHANQTAWGYWDNDIKSSRQTWCASRKKTKIFSTLNLGLGAFSIICWSQIIVSFTYLNILNFTCLTFKSIFFYFRRKCFFVVGDFIFILRWYLVLLSALV